MFWIGSGPFSGTFRSTESIADSGVCKAQCRLYSAFAMKTRRKSARPCLTWS